MNSIKVRTKYGGVHLTCDQDNFAKIVGPILADASVSESCDHLPSPAELRFLTIAMPRAERSHRFRLSELIMLALGLSLSGVIIVAGVISIAKWVIFPAT